MTDQAVELDRHRGMAAQKATESQQTKSRSSPAREGRESCQDYA